MRDYEEVTVKLLGDATDYLRMLSTAQRATQASLSAITQTATGIEQITGKITGLTSNIFGSMTAMIGMATGLGAAFKAIKLAADLEQLSISFKVLTNSADMSKKIIADLTKFAAETPFQMPEIAMAAKQMMAFGATAQEIIPTMKLLGDVSSALQIPLSSLTYLYGTLKAQGQAYTRDIMQFAMRGIPIWKELEKQFGKTNAEVREMLEDGKIGFRDVEKAFQTMTNTGGRFANMMKEQSTTLTGLWSTLKDNVEFALRDIGEEFIRVSGMKEWLKSLIELAGQAGKAFKDMNAQVKVLLVYLTEGIVLVGAFALGFGALKVVFGFVASSITAILGAIFTLKVGMGMVSIGFTAAAAAAAPFLAVLTAIAAVAWVIDKTIGSSNRSAAAAFNEANAPREAVEAGRAQRRENIARNTINDILGDRTSTPERRMSRLEYGKDAAESTVRDRERQVGRVEEKRAGFEGLGPAGMRLFNAELRMANLHLTQAKNAVEMFKKAIAEVESPINPDQVEKFVKDLKKKVREIGMSPDQIEFDRLFGGGGFLKERGQSMQAMKDLDAGKANVGLKEMIAASAQAIYNINQTAEQIKIMEMAGKGANPALVALAEAIGKVNVQMQRAKEIRGEAAKLDEATAGNLVEARDIGKFMGGDWGKMMNPAARQRNEQIEQMKRQGVPEADLKELREAHKRANAADKWKEQLQESRQLTEQFLTPQQKFAKTQEELNELWRSGALTDLNVYTKALVEARSALTALHHTSQSIDAVQFGGAEALSRIEEYRAGKNRMNIGGPPDRVGGAPGMPNLRQKDVEDVWGQMKIALLQLVAQGREKLDKGFVELVAGVGLGGKS